MPSIATVRNPLDSTAVMTTRLSEVRTAIEIILADPAVDLFIFYYRALAQLWR